ncbi:MAG: MarR family transcriptional regulator [Bacteroidales bacterium]|nr:MarR family transcriptional regulator [Bacteroidales bacterium]
MNKKENTTPASVGKLIKILDHSAQKYFHNTFKNYSIGHAQIMTLHIIFRNNGISQAELTKRLCLDKASVTSQLNILEKNNYIIRKTSKKDGRLRNIYLTDKSKSIQNSIQNEFSGWSEILLQGFNKKDKDLTFNYLEKMIKNASDKIKEISKDETI